jgi:putative ABC transport system ATP-binding protein
MVSQIYENHKNMIELQDVVKTFKSGAGVVKVLKGVDLNVKRGEFVCVEGPSGSGKSTLLNMIAGIDRPSSGQVYVANQAVHLLSEDRLAKWRGRNIGVIFQFFQLMPTLSILENVMLPMDFTNTYQTNERKQKAMALLEIVGIDLHAKKLPSALSGGEQQRVAIARALANDPPLLVADEPTGNLDSRTAVNMFEMFVELSLNGKTLFIVTHDRFLSQYAQRVVHIRDGNVFRDENNHTHISHQEIQLMKG